ncbi:MAG TPA: gliding motility-associated C-terminal domain-containing protein [Chitinophagaceae bacterium]|nr:gliding motility-associated C-terminal domain-containing protein [Chitinophagaceae bacterium]
MNKHCIISFLFCCIISSGIAQISPDSLVLYMPLNGNTDDLSGNNYNGVLYGATQALSFDGNKTGAFYFDGKDAIVIHNVKKLDGPVKAFSVLMRIRPSIARAAGVPFYNFFSWQRETADPQQAYLHGKLRIGWAPPNVNYHPRYDFLGYFGDWCSGNERTSNGYEMDTVTANNQWQTIAIVYDQGDMRVYFDCKIMSFWVNNFPPVSDLCGSEPIEIILGSVSPDASVAGFRNFVGSIDEVRVYKRALTDDEVRYFSDSVCRGLAPPVPAISYAVNPCQPNEVVFSDSSFVSNALTIDRRVWKISNGDSAEGKDFTYRFPHTGQYNVELQLYTGGRIFSADTVVNISTVDALKFIKATQTNVVSCGGAATQLAVSGGVSYTWQPCTNLDNCNIGNPVVTPQGDMVYTVTGTDENHCVDSAQISVTVLNGNDTRVHVPTAFTPNGDGSNDTWGPLSSYPLSDFSLSVYNRWGLNVFNTRNQGNKWDGTTHGVKAPPGTYIWVLNYKNGSGCDALSTKGTVVLIR